MKHCFSIKCPISVQGQDATIYADDLTQYYGSPVVISFYPKLYCRIVAALPLRYLIFLMLHFIGYVPVIMQTNAESPSFVFVVTVNGEC